MQNENKAVRVAVIGSGAAGMMAAGTALLYGADVTLFEHTEKQGRKLSITGKGRCNVTNDCPNDEFIKNVVTNPRFLYTAISEFDTQSTMSFFEGLGVPLKTERGRRVFPVSDRAWDIVDALKKYCSGAHLVHAHVSELTVENGYATGLIADGRSYGFDSIILASGGRSYPITGSDGSGYDIARKAGHTVTAISGSLVPVETYGNYAQRMQGLSLKNTGLKIRDAGGRCLYEDFGELLFTHFGMSGPMILSASAYMKGKAIDTLCAELDMKPALDERTLDTRILSDFSKYANKNLDNALFDLLPNKMIDVIIDDAKIDRKKKVNSVTKEERKRLVASVKSLRIPLKRLRPVEEAIITSGGVSVKEISPKTMMSNKVHSLYFAGEVIDVDAYTGGYNLQIAFSTGYLAGIHAAKEDNICSK